MTACVCFNSLCLFFRCEMKLVMPPVGFSDFKLGLAATEWLGPALGSACLQSFSLCEASGVPILSLGSLGKRNDTSDFQSIS